MLHRSRHSGAISVTFFGGNEYYTIATMFDDGKIKDIRDYCEADVLNTYLVYLRYQHHSGVLSTESYNQAVGDILSLIQQEKESRPHLGEFFTAWQEACGDCFMLNP